MKVLMIILMFGGSDGGRATRTIEFASEALCQDARVALLADNKSYANNWRPVIVCAKTGY